MTNLRTAAEFWQRQPFAYLETYSFNRGPKTAAEFERLTQELAATEQALQTAPHRDLRKLKGERRELRQALSGGEYNVWLKDPAAADAYTTKKIATLPAASAEAAQLTAALLQAGEQEGFFMCPPVFRDALVYYDAAGKRLRTLNICFECLMMQASDVGQLEADFATYGALAQLLTGLGHPIASDYHPTEND